MEIPVASEDVSLKHIIDVLTKVTRKTHKLRTLNDKQEFGVFGKDEELKDISISKKPTKNFEQYELETYGNV
ncbi:hypothetical protein C1645_841334 [Glomus cerebriforme]|uniref:Uncharacterized protein n=1 Tax=Glomus cerebriforme TaxID=658196 RepID=A0A397S383_9GLOM|nr:hypothetical protein C1645_841334 [Glomus cerebriforme]